MIVLAVVAVALAAIGAQLLLSRQHQAAVERLLEAQAAERARWDHQRWELNTRIQAPEVARMAPPAPPAPVGAEAEPGERDEDDVDESHLVGTIG